MTNKPTETRFHLPTRGDGPGVLDEGFMIHKTLVVALFALFAAASSAFAADSLGEIRARLQLNVDPDRVSVSGLSSGGWMANQFHVAFSSKIMGAGILAAGPYHCAGGSSFLCDWTPYGWLSPHDSCEAVHVCTRFARKNFGYFGYYLGPPDADQSENSTSEEAAGGTIDPIENLKGDRVWLFSGRLDSLAPPEIMAVLRRYYADLFARPEVANPPGNLTLVDEIEAEHAMIVDIPGPASDNTCDLYASPYIDDCDYPAAGKLLAFIYRLAEPASHPVYGDWDRSRLREFDQGAFFDRNDASVSLDGIGHLYVPATCLGAAPCPLHVAFHGCEQYDRAIDAAHSDLPKSRRPYFHSSAGYNEYAERYGIVVLYPQTTSWGDETDSAKNPKGCWDWWGYSGDDYFRRAGKQMQAVERMIGCLTGERTCPQ